MEENNLNNNQPYYAQGKNGDAPQIPELQKPSIDSLMQPQESMRQEETKTLENIIDSPVVDTNTNNMVQNETNYLNEPIRNDINPSPVIMDNTINNVDNNNNGISNDYNLDSANSYSDDFYDEGKNGKGKFVIIIAIIIALMIIGLLVYYFVLMSPKSLSNKMTNELYSHLKEVLKDDDLNELNTIKLDGNIDVEVGEFTLGLDLLLGANLKENYVSSNLALESEGSKLIDGELLINQDNAFIYSKSIFEKTLKFKLDTSLNLNNQDTQTLSNDEILYLANIFKNELNNTFSNSKASKKITNKEIVGTKKLVFKFNYTFTNEAIRNLLQSYLEKLKNDSKSIAILEKIYQSDSASVKEILEENISSFKENVSDDVEDINITFYVSLIGNDILEIDYYTSQGRIVFEDGDDILQLNAYDEKNNNILNLVISEIDDKIDTTGYIIDEDYKYSIAYATHEENNIFYNDLIITAYEVNNPSNKLAKITMDFTLEENANINKLDISNSVLLEELTEEEMNQLTMNLYNLLFIFQLDSDLLM